MVQVVGPEFKPQYRKTKQNKKTVDTSVPKHSHTQDSTSLHDIGT
jgi:hypothetical protein